MIIDNNKFSRYIDEYKESIGDKWLFWGEDRLDIDDKKIIEKCLENVYWCEEKCPDITSIINDELIDGIITFSDNISILTRVLWECDSLKGYVCIDTDDPYIHENLNTKLMRKKLWEVIGRNAKDSIEGGGWVNSYNREKFSEIEMQEFSENVAIKLTPYLNNDTKVLEIGCASGITMFKLCNMVRDYYAIDLSSINIEKNKEKAIKLGVNNLHLYDIPAHELLSINENEFDIVIMNSVTQCFCGINYLRKIIEICIKLIKKNGYIFIGDVMDIEKKHMFYESLLLYKKKHPLSKTKLDLSQELYLSKEYFNDLYFDFVEISKIMFSDKIHSIDNELTRYRYDVMIFVDKNDSNKTNKIYKINKRKYQFSNNMLLEC